MRRLAGRAGRSIAATLLAALACGAAAAQSTAPLRIGVVTGSSGACGAPAPDAPAGQAAYVAHLAQRLKRTVEICPLQDAAEGARRLGEGAISFAQIDPETYQPVASSVRPLLTTRERGGFGRVETVMIIRAGGAEGEPSATAGRAGVAGAEPYELDLPKRALADHGHRPTDVENARVYPGPVAALKGLRDGEIDTLVLHSAAWQRLCRPMAAGATPCADLKEAFRGRPRATQAWAVRRDIDDDTRFRLVGIHVALHIENRAAFDWIAPGAGELEPTEAGALDGVNR